jgi:hypothetical protein
VETPFATHYRDTEELPPRTSTTYYGSGLRDSFTRSDDEYGRDNCGRRAVGFGDNPRTHSKLQDEEDNGFEDEPRDGFRNRPERDYEKNIANLAKM